MIEGTVEEFIQSKWEKSHEKSFPLKISMIPPRYEYTGSGPCRESGSHTLIEIF